MLNNKLYGILSRVEIMFNRYNLLGIFFDEPNPNSRTQDNEHVILKKLLQEEIRIGADVVNACQWPPTGFGEKYKYFL